MLRGVKDDGSVNLIIKANTAGVLETILKEVNKIISGKDKIMIVDTGIGSFNDNDF